MDLGCRVLVVRAEKMRNNSATFLATTYSQKKQSTWASCKIVCKWRYSPNCSNLWLNQNSLLKRRSHTSLVGRMNDFFDDHYYMSTENHTKSMTLSDCSKNCAQKIVSSQSATVKTFQATFYGGVTTMPIRHQTLIVNEQFLIFFQLLSRGVKALLLADNF